jgi:hypothetical protein
MDVESLAKQLILKNMTPEQQAAVLDSIKSTVAQAKEVQKQRVGENVQVVVQALKKIEADIRARYDETGKAIEKRVASIKDGKDGKNGRDGKDGKDGRAGRDGSQGPKGMDGLPGRDGVDGENGVSVTDAHIDFDGSLIISLSSGRTINVGEVVAPDLAEKIKVITNGGGTSQSVLDTLASLQTQINNIYPSQTGNSGKFLTTNGTAVSWASIAAGGLSYQGTWNANTNTPTLTSSTGTAGYYYIVATAGSTNLDGITDWQIGDWLLFNGTVWQKIDQSNLVTSVNGQTGAVSLTTTNIAEGTNLYYTDTRSRASVSAGTGISYSSATGVITNAAPDQTVALTGAGATTISGTYPSFTISSVNTTYSPATSTVAGLIELGSDTQQTVAANAVSATASRSYALQVNAAGQGVINVPWTDTNSGGTVTSVGGTGTVNGISLSGTVTSTGNLTLGGTLSGVSLTTQVSGTLPVANGGTGITSLGTGVATFLGTPSSANLAAAVTDETGTGALVFATSPTLVTPALGTPASGVVTNLTGTASININGTVGATTANTGAFTTLSATGVTTVQAGTVSAPAITTTGDTNTGIFFPAADTIAFAEGGVEALRITSAADLQFNSGYGSVAAAYGCRAWVNFNGTGTPAIRNDGNVTSITDNGTGDYTVNFTNSLPDINYAVVATGVSISTGTSTPRVASVRSTTDSDGVNSLATGSVRIGVRTGAGGSADIDVISVAIFR